jgi:hypothetical protein
MTVVSLHLESPFCDLSVVEKTSLSQQFAKFIYDIDGGCLENGVSFIIKRK